MTITVKIEKEVTPKIIKVHAKVRDCGSYELVADDGTTLREVDQDYVPSFFPEDHYGDYLQLDIDIETGQITNWVKPSDEDLQEWINNGLEEG